MGDGLQLPPREALLDRVGLKGVRGHERIMGTGALRGGPAERVSCYVRRGGLVAHFVFVTWDGGGNVSVALGIGLALADRGHDVTVLGPASLRSLIEETGLTHQELGVCPPVEPSSRAEYLVEVVGSTILAADLQRLTEQLQPDGLVIDCNLSWALELPVPISAAVLVHTALGLYLPAWQAVIDAANELRRDAGLAAFPPAAVAWSSREALIVTSVIDFDRPPTPFPGNATYVGPVRQPHGKGQTDAVPPEPSLLPLVLISYSTDPLQNSPERLQTALNALAELPVRVLGTTSGTFDAGHLTVPSNAAVLNHMPHHQFMPMAQVAVGHAGHGTTLAALCHGVPMVCVPGLGRDQVPIARRVAELGLGIALASGASEDDIRTAVTAILADASYRERAQQFKHRCGDLDGAATAAELLEATLLSPRSRVP
jgi:UDP:flavonoid glycosyltransferase YjiC (YdhE family)